MRKTCLQGYLFFFYKILKKHGTDRVLFATDCPWGYQKKDVESLRKLDLTEEVKECIFYKNANDSEMERSGIELNDYTYS